MDQTIESLLAAGRAPLDALEALIAGWLPGRQIAALAAFGVCVLLILAIGSRSLVRAMTGLIVTALGVAGMRLLLASPFLAIMLLLIYVVAVAESRSAGASRFARKARLAARTREELRLDLLAVLTARAARLPGGAKAPAGASAGDSPAEARAYW
jgi:hypothetical protein